MKWLPPPPSEPCQHWFHDLPFSFCAWCGKLVGEIVIPHDLSEGVNHYSKKVSVD